MNLTLSLLIILITELPIVGFFSRRRKRRGALLVGLLVNFISWIIYHVIRLNFEDVNLPVLYLVLAVAEGIAFYFMLGRNLKKAIFIALIANLISFFAIKYLASDPPEPVQKRMNMIT